MTAQSMKMTSVMFHNQRQAPFQGANLKMIQSALEIKAKK